MKLIIFITLTKKTKIGKAVTPNKTKRTRTSFNLINNADLFTMTDRDKHKYKCRLILTQIQQIQMNGRAESKGYAI